MLILLDIKTLMGKAVIPPLHLANIVRAWAQSKDCHKHANIIIKNKQNLLGIKIENKSNFVAIIDLL